jgi:hypothetical protein
VSWCTGLPTIGTERQTCSAVFANREHSCIAVSKCAVWCIVCAPTCRKCLVEHAVEI